MDTIKLKRATKSVANASTKVLEKDEVLVVTPDAGSGKGKCQFRFGDGITQVKDSPDAIDGENADDMKVSAFTTPSDENPVLSAGETVKILFGKIKKKFTYLENLVGNVKTVTNLFGSTDSKTVAQGLQNLVNTKVNISDLYDGLDSVSTILAPTANAVRKVNEKTDNNAEGIAALNSDLEYDFNGKDLNTIIHNCVGFGNTANVTNCKKTGYGAIFEVHCYGNTKAVQVQRDIRAAGVVTFKRSLVEGAWSGWIQDITTSDFEYFDGVVTVAPGVTSTVSITYKNHYATIPVPVAVVGGTAVDPQYVHWTVRSRNTTGCVIAITNTHPSTSIQPSIYGSVMAKK